MTALMMGIDEDLVELYVDFFDRYGVSTMNVSLSETAPSHVDVEAGSTVLLDRGRDSESSLTIAAALKRNNPSLRLISWCSLPRHFNAKEQAVFDAQLIKPTPGPMLLAAVRGDPCPKCGRGFVANVSHLWCQSHSILPPLPI